ncbi:UNKNOWN [Stylonychia lemnae]|uniref:Uncharacterized protein n=1 Tax=Stylonychia lemnae TaxID=5949 RepID=A0A078B3Z5_STYLE|nr:UNKNOWN [Stylonychia lemnae]|eukprot:CDW88956.1 UNKNOWN [Stylonychia lemnae]
MLIQYQTQHQESNSNYMDSDLSQQPSINYMHVQSISEYNISSIAKPPNKFKDAYQKKIYKVQKRSDHLRKSTMEINYQMQQEFYRQNLNNGDNEQHYSSLHARSVQQVINDKQGGHNNISDGQIDSIMPQPSIAIKSQSHNRSTDSCSMYFEKKLTDRKKRTFNVLMQFNPKLAHEVVYKGSSNIPKLSKIDVQFKKHIDAATIIQKYFRAWRARQEYAVLVYKKYQEIEHQQELENEKLLDQWILEQETKKLQEEIDEKNRLFKFQLKKRHDAALLIQRQVRYYLRKKNSGISTTQILERKKLDDMMRQNDDDFNDYTQMDLSMQLSIKQGERKSRCSPKSVGHSKNRIGRGHLFNRIRQLQIETSNQSMIEPDMSQTKSPINVKLQGSTTPIDLSNSSYLLNNQRSNSFLGASKTPQNITNLIKISRIQNNLQKKNSNELDSSIGHKVADVEELKQMIGEINRDQKLQGKIKNENRISYENNSSENANQSQKVNDEKVKDAGKSGQSLFSIDSSSGKLDGVLNLASGGEGDSSNRSPFIFQKNLLSSGNSAVNQDSHLDNSLNNLFDSLKQPTYCNNNFDLTQKLQDNFHELISHCETIQELESLATPLPSLQDNLNNQQKKSRRQKRSILDSIDASDNLIVEPNINEQKISKEFQSKILILPPKNHQVIRTKNEPEKNIYNQFLREESIKDGHLNHQVSVGNSNQYTQQQQIVDQQAISIMDLIQPPSYYHYDDTISSSGNIDESNANDIFGNGNDQYLNENDFPMTQLIKERTLCYQKEKLNKYEYQLNILKQQEQQTNQISQQVQQQQQQQQNYYDYDQRFKYFEEILREYNTKEKFLRQLAEKRNDLLKRIKFHQAIISNFNQMIENANGGQPLTARRQKSVKRSQQFKNEQPQQIKPNQDHQYYQASQANTNRGGQKKAVPKQNLGLKNLNQVKTKGAGKSAQISAREMITNKDENLQNYNIKKTKSRDRRQQQQQHVIINNQPAQLIYQYQSASNHHKQQLQ